MRFLAAAWLCIVVAQPKSARPTDDQVETSFDYPEASKTYEYEAVPQFQYYEPISYEPVPQTRYEALPTSPQVLLPAASPQVLLPAATPQVNYEVVPQFVSTPTFPIVQPQPAIPQFIPEQSFIPAYGSGLVPPQQVFPVQVPPRDRNRPLFIPDRSTAIAPGLPSQGRIPWQLHDKTQLPLPPPARLIPVPVPVPVRPRPRPRPFRRPRFVPGPARLDAVVSEPLTSEVADDAV